MPRLEKIPIRGCWIMVRQLIPIEIPIDPLSVYYALPIKKMVQNDFFTLPETYFPVSQEKVHLKNHHEEIYASIITEYGEVLLKEHEYSILEDQTLHEYFDYLRTGAAEMHMFGKTSATNKKLNEAVFYARSRGISVSNAMEMAIGMVRNRTTFYITMDPEYQRYFTRYYDDYIKKKINFLKKQNHENKTQVS